MNHPNLDFSVLATLTAGKGLLVVSPGNGQQFLRHGDKSGIVPACILLEFQIK